MSDIERPDCLACEHNVEASPPLVVFRKCELGAFNMLQGHDCKQLPIYFMFKCPKSIYYKRILTPQNKQENDTERNIQG